MEDRYEIKGKIGQGGLGAVYRAHDIRMNREVAIKRILMDTDDDTVPQEATRQLIKEAGALASLQHPNIVTIYDVGTDEDGPFVVMELLAGNDLQDLIEKGSFTWPDFRQLAMQTLEALIAAQELHLVHRDLKPSNIMLTWLPSGKFQVKIVDFGLAKLSVKPSLQTIDQSDGVFGSIYFMAPEQFERVPIDLKCDLYAIGCVFYYALTGTYPFDGDHAAQVMAAHLQHYVEPLQEVREGIPVWACDWVMWHINRRPEDRPASAHESLKLFVLNDEYPNPELSIGKPVEAIEQPKRPRLMIPGSAPVPDVVKETTTTTQSVKTASMPKPLAPPVGSKPSVHTSQQVVNTSACEIDPEYFASVHTSQQVVNTSAPQAAPVQSAPEVPANFASEPAVPVLQLPSPAAAVPASPATTFMGHPPVPATAPASSILKRAVAPTTPTTPAAPTSPISKPTLPPTGKLTPPSPTAPAAPAALAAPASAVVLSAAFPATKKKGLSNGMKTFIALILSLLTVGLAVFFLKKSGANANTILYNEMLNQAAVEGATEVTVDKRKLEILLSSVASVAANDRRDGIYMALYLAKSTDGTDVDARIAEFATTQVMIPNVRVMLLREVLRKRNNPAIIGTLLNFARSTDDDSAAVAAIEATRFMATDSHFEEFIEIIRTTKADSVRKAAEENAAKIIEKSTTKNSLLVTLIKGYESAANDAMRQTMLRLLGRIGGEKALELVEKNLQSAEIKDQIAAIVALSTWGDHNGYVTLINFLKSAKDLDIRRRAFSSAFQYASQDETNAQENWSLLSGQAKTKDEQDALIRGLVNVKPAPWVFEILDKIVATSDYDDAVELAKRAIDRLKDIEKIQGGGEDDEEE